MGYGAAVSRRARLTMWRTSAERHVGSHLPHGPDGFLGLAHIVPSGRLSIGEGLADDVLKVGVRSAMSVRPAPKEKPRRSRAPLPLLVPCFLARTRPLLCSRRSMRRGTSEPACNGEKQQPAATAILHGLARRTAPQTPGLRTTCTHGCR